MKTLLVALALLAPLLCSTTAKQLPSALKICNRDDPELNTCLAEAVQQALPFVKDGVNEMGILPIDPMNFGSVTAEGNPSSPVNVAQKVIDAKIHNLVKSKIDKVEATYDDKEFKLTVHVSNKFLTVEGGYELDGKILVLPISGKGHAQIDFEDVKATIVLDGVFFEKKGKTHLKLNDATVSINAGKIKYNFENLFNGDERLQAEMNKLLDENWKEIYQEIRAPYEQAMAGFIKNLFQAVFDRFTYDQLFPLSK